ncbi:hypothetical protein RF11_07475 [Thelohanellus kitauei]|uniref:Tc1-like transposase DDE domain-containing protein n=1 Tax=Thelohanellus kitauei TaxID=669202 RepID=A0A0C2MLC0_THEKT|nr:hypothetical protein RF11_07475 [Thelohanellus kitauei]
MSKQVSCEIPKLVIKMANAGQGPQYISEALCCSRNHDRRVVKVYDTDDQIDEDCSITLKSLKAKLFERFEVKVCANTISKAIGSFCLVSKECISFYREGMPHIILRTKNFSGKLYLQSGVVNSETSERPYNCEVYADFLTNQFRTLRLRETQNGVFVMDNVGFHKLDDIKSLFSANNYTVHQVPPYSNFLNPKWEAFSKAIIIVRRSELKNHRS